MKTLPTLTLATVLALGGFLTLWQADYLAAQPQPEKPAAPAETAPAATESPAAADPEEQAKAAQQQLRDAITKVKTYKSISAKIQLNLNLVNYGFAGEGKYLVAPKNKMLYEIVVQLPNTTGRLLEVCDGEILYTRHEILPKGTTLPDAGKDKKEKEKNDKEKVKEKNKVDLLQPEVSVTRRNVTTILEHLERQPDPNIHQMWVVELGLGGLPALLASIDKAMVFKSLKPDTVRGQKVTVIEGTWTRSQREVWIQKGQKELPQLVPDLARISIDQETGFPLRIVFLKPIPDSKGLRTMVSVDFLDVALNQPIDDKQFVYKYDGLAAQELTEAIIGQIQQAAQAAEQGQPEKTNLPGANQ
jgi:hypothetical protein